MRSPTGDAGSGPVEPPNTGSLRGDTEALVAAVPDIDDAAYNTIQVDCRSGDGRDAQSRPGGCHGRSRAVHAASRRPGAYSTRLWLAGKSRPAAI